MVSVDLNQSNFNEVKGLEPQCKGFEECKDRAVYYFMEIDYECGVER